MIQPRIVRIGNRFENRMEAFLEDCGFPGMTKFARVSFMQRADNLPAHMHENAMELCFHVRGTQQYHVDGKLYKNHGGTIFLTYPNEMHGTFGLPQEKDTLLYYWHINTVTDNEHFLGLPREDALSLVEAVKKLPRIFPVDKNVAAMYEQAYRAITRPGERQETRIRCALFTLLNEIVEQAERSTAGSITAEILSALDYIEEWFDNGAYEALRLEDIADHVHLSISQFKSRFKEETGCAPWKYICERRVEIAKELLKNGSSVTEAAYLLGYSSTQHFCASFKAYTGYSPGLWMKKSFGEYNYNEEMP